MSWTDERIEILRNLWDRGMSASQISEQLGGNITRNAVIGKAHRLGLKSRPSPVKAESSRKAPPHLAPTPRVVTTPPAIAPKPVVAAPSPHVSDILSRQILPPMPSPAPVPRKPRAEGDKIITLLDLSDKICKWPIGHPDEEDFHFCGSPVNPGTPYCAEHCAVAYQSQLPRKDRPLRPLPMPRYRV
jgi:GcrA cell cycle regulator